MRPSDRRRYRVDDELSPREKRELQERGEWKEEEHGGRKAPLPFRVIAWASLIVIFFAIGYGATSIMFKWMDRGGQPENGGGTAATTGGASSAAVSPDAVSPDNSASIDDKRAVFCSLYIPDDDKFVTRRIRCSDGIREDNIRETLSAYLDAVKEGKMIDPAVQGLHVFQSGDWLYVNMNNSFLSSLKTIGAKKSEFLLTGLVRTMSENFSPINKVKFYIDGKEVDGKAAPVNLSQPWSMAGKS